MPFAPTAALQEHLRADFLAGTGPETLLLLEHDAGHHAGAVGAQAAHVLAPAAELARRGIDLIARRAAATSPITGPASWSATRSSGCAAASSPT